VDAGHRITSTLAGLKSRHSAGGSSHRPRGHPTFTAFPHHCTKVGLTLLIDFEDDPSTITQSNINAYCNGDNYTGFSNNGSVKKYYQDVSGGLLTYSNVVTVYIHIPNSLHPKSYYNDTTKDCGAQAKLMITDAVAIMKAMTNFNTDLLPGFDAVTADTSKNITACNVFYAGGNGGVWSYGLWPHSSSMTALEISPGGKRITRYQISNIGSSLALSTFCHENGHMLCGFPDIYDYDYDSEGGAGRFCLMDYGTSGSNPCQICAYLKRAAGWATTIDLTSSSRLTGTLSASGSNFNRFSTVTPSLANRPNISSWKTDKRPAATPACQRRVLPFGTLMKGAIKTIRT
jgi:M6 family metalloprotease-like protein